nr:tRNA pseudouridine(55) synthase TruB [Glaciecola sp. XM2]
MVNGILLIDKHTGESSNAIVQQIKRLYGAAKAGHTGALDPLATGMLPVCLGEATKFSQFLLDADKTYEVEAQLGVRTDTSDADGEVVATSPVSVTQEQLEEALVQFRGKIQQVPSMFSALKHNGHPLYYYARQGINIPREPRDIEVYKNELLAFSHDSVSLRIRCSKGTYIRTIIDDLGQVLGCGAHVRELRRTQVAQFPLQMESVEHYQQLVSGQQAPALYDTLDAELLPMDTPVLDLPSNTLDSSSTKLFQHGQQVPLGSECSQQIEIGQAVRVYGPNALFLGVATIDDNHKLQPKRLVVYAQPTEAG